MLCYRSHIGRVIRSLPNSSSSRRWPTLPAVVSLRRRPCGDDIDDTAGRPRAALVSASSAPLYFRPMSAALLKKDPTPFIHNEALLFTSPWEGVEGNAFDSLSGL